MRYAFKKLSKSKKYCKLVYIPINVAQSTAGDRDWVETKLSKIEISIEMIFSLIMKKEKIS